MTRKLALIVGGSRGIGAACASAFAADDGYEVAYTYAVGKKEGAAGKAYQLDVVDAASVGATFEAVVRDFGRAPDVIVVSAGINVPPGPLAGFDTEQFRRLVEVNIVGAFNVLAESARRVADGGSIIAITTSMVRVAIPGAGPYIATKAAVEALVKSLSRELAARKVRVNAIAPGPVDTELFHAGKTDEARQRSAALSPFNRIGQPDEIANVVHFIASDKASWVTGQIVQPNGGFV